MSRRPTASPWLVAVVVLAGALVAPSPARAAATSERLAGASRYETAAAVAATYRPGLDRVYVATGANFPDAVAGAAVAALDDAPVLLVTHDTVPAATADALRRLRPGVVTILGGTSAISARTEARLREISAARTERHAGETRYGTAAALVAARVQPGVEVAYVATGVDFADTLAGGPAAAVEGGPLLLVPRDRLPDAVGAVLRDLDPGRIVVLGGPRAVSASVADGLTEFTDGTVERRAGPNRFATAASTVSEAFPAAADTVYLATALDYPDALAGGAAAGRDGAPLLISRQDCLPDDVLAEVERLAPERIVLLGGPAALADAVGDLRPCSDDWVPATTIASGLDVPWDLDFTPDGTAYVTERDRGWVRRIAPDGTVDPDPVLDLSAEIDNDHEGGLLGLEVSPDFAEDGLLYALYVGSQDQRIVRFDTDGDDLEVVVSGLPIGAPGNLSHFAGRIAFNPHDGMLYVGVGDVRDEEAAQDLSSLAGKILRYTPDGEVPDDNPYAGSPVWARGFRDPQGLAWDADGNMYASEFGPNSDDEVNRIFPRGNYGWPRVTGSDGPGGYEDPIVVRQPPEASWSGATVLVDGAIPQWEGDLFVAALRGTRLYRIDLEDGRVQGVEDLRVGVYGRMRHVVPAPDGSLWVLTSNQDDNGDPVPGDDRIIRFGPPAPSP